MKNKIVCVFLLSIFYSLLAMGQKIRLNEIEISEPRSNDSKLNIMSEKSKLRIVDRDNLTSKSSDFKLNISQLISSSGNTQQKEDTLYFSNIATQNSWIVGIGDTLTKDEATNRYLYYRFTMNNSKGHWQHIEAMSKNEVSKTYNAMCFYNGLDIGEVDENLKSSIDKISQWFEISDLDGNELLEERAYDADGNLVLTSMYHRHHDGRIIVCYNDSHGFPVDFMPDNTYTYGHVFVVTLDENGKNSIVECLDGAGFPRLDAYGTYQCRKIFDERGYVIEKSYHNSVGMLMNNKFGYAIERSELSPDRKHVVRKHFDVNNNLVKSTEPGLWGFMIEEIEYDDMDLIKSLCYFTIKNGEKINDEVDGVHRYEWFIDESDGSLNYKQYDKNLNEI